MICDIHVCLNVLSSGTASLAWSLGERARGTRQRDRRVVPSAVADQRGDPAVERRVAAAAPVVADEGGDL